ncbi:MAG: LysM domain-containing protein [Nitrolancea sp.]
MTQAESFVRRLWLNATIRSSHDRLPAWTKRLFTGVAAVGVLGLCACGSSGSPSASPTVVATETAIPAIPIVTPTPGVPSNAGADGATPAPGTTPAVDQSTNGQNGTYTVQQGDTLYQIAVKFSVTLQDLMQANSITDPSALQAGQVIVIPPH